MSRQNKTAPVSHSGTKPARPWSLQRLKAASS